MSLKIERYDADGKLITSGSGGSGAPTDATYITQTADGDLSNEQALSSLDSGLMVVTTGTGVVSSADTKAELEAQLTDVSDIAEADGDTYTGVHDFGGADSLEIPNGAAPTVNAAGEVAVDTTVADYTGLITYYDGSEALFVVALPTGNLSTTDGDIIVYDATNDEFDMVGNDASITTYTPAVAADWDGDADPGNTDDALDQLAERVDDLEGASGSGVPAGAMMMWTTDSAPVGWLLCYGQAVSRATYADLFSAIGETFGVGDGSTTFNLPDLRGRFPLGQDDMGGSSANRVTDASADSLGGSGGAETHTLSEAEMASHTHSYRYFSGGSNTGWSGVASKNMDSTGSAGSDSAHNNMPPYLTLNCIIKT